jgi:hypothetical protein
MNCGYQRIQLPSHFPKPIFTDDLYQHSVELLADIEKAIPQHSLTNEIRRSVEIKLDRDASFVTDLLTHLGMVLSLLNKTGGGRMVNANVGSICCKISMNKYQQGVL